MALPGMVAYTADSIVADLYLGFSEVGDTVGDILQAVSGLIVVPQEILKSPGTVDQQAPPEHQEVLQGSLMVAYQHLGVADAPGGEAAYS